MRDTIKESNPCCVVASPIVRNSATNESEQAIHPATNHATTSLKALADKVLRRNKACNTPTTKGINSCNKHPFECHSQPLACNTLSTLKAAASSDWEWLENDPEALAAWSSLVETRRIMAAGKIPTPFTAMINCRGCGDVLVHPALVNGGNVLGCPWCWIRGEGIKLPNFTEHCSYQRNNT